MNYVTAPCKPKFLKNLFPKSDDDAWMMEIYITISEQVVKAIRKLLRYGEVRVPIGLMPYFSSQIKEDLPTVFWQELGMLGHDMVIKMV
jgi:hypothetical protein